MLRLAAGLILLLAGAGGPSAQENSNAIRPRSDYMSSILSRNTKPIGLKEDRRLRTLLNQSNRKWAIRSSVRHILD